MKRTKEMAQKYQQQQNNLLSNDSDPVGQEHQFAKMNTGLYSTLSQMNSTKTNQTVDYQEEAIKHMLKLNNYHGLPFKELIQMPYKMAGGSAFNLVNHHRNAQLHNSMMSDEAFAEDLSDDHSPDECMSDEQVSEDEQPLDFSIKSKKEEHEKETTKSPFAHSSIDQVDGDWARMNSSKYPHSTMFNPLNDGALSFYAQQSTNLINHYAFMNPLLLGESQSNLMHSEPSSPEGLSSSSSTSSRSSSQGYYSGSSLNGANTTNFNAPSSFNQSVAPSFYSNVFNQSFNKSNLQAPPSYASLNFSQNSKPSSSTRNSTQQVRPSVIVSTNSKTTSRPHARSSFGNPTTALDAKLSYATGSDKIVDSIEEHFRLSLGDSYNKMNSTPTKDTLQSNSFSSKQSSQMSIEDPVSRSLSQDSPSTTTVIESSTSVDDHFAKALGETWFKLKKDSL